MGVQERLGYILKAAKSHWRIFKQYTDMMWSYEDWGKFRNELAFHLGWEVGDWVFIAGEGVGAGYSNRKEW